MYVCIIIAIHIIFKYRRIVLKLDFNTIILFDTMYSRREKIGNILHALNSFRMIRNQCISKLGNP